MVCATSHADHFHWIAVPSSIRITGGLKPLSLNSASMSFFGSTITVTGMQRRPPLQRAIYENAHAHRAIYRQRWTLSVTNWPSTVASTVNLVRPTTLPTTVHFITLCFELSIQHLATIGVTWQFFLNLEGIIRISF